MALDPGGPAPSRADRQTPETQSQATEKFIVAIELETRKRKVLCQSDGDLNKVICFDTNFVNVKFFDNLDFVKEFMQSMFPDTEYQIMQAL